MPRTATAMVLCVGVLDEEAPDADDEDGDGEEALELGDPAEPDAEDVAEEDPASLPQAARPTTRTRPTAHRRLANHVVLVTKGSLDRRF